MGTWGPAIFSNDAAADVREDYLTWVGDGLSGPDATARLLREWVSTVEDPDSASVFWLALAATQSRVGRLENVVKVHALDIIEAGSDLARWADDPRGQSKRREHLEKLRRTLEEPQPKAKRVRRRFRDACDWGVGEILSYQLRSRKIILLRVIGHHEDRGGRSPVCELLDWIGDAPPSRLRLRLLKVRIGDSGGSSVTQFLLGRSREAELPADRVIRLGMEIKPTQVPGRYAVFPWALLDQLLAERFDLS